MEKSTSSPLKMKTTHVNPEHGYNIIQLKTTFHVSLYLCSSGVWECYFRAFNIIHTVQHLTLSGSYTAAAGGECLAQG